MFVAAMLLALANVLVPAMLPSGPVSTRLTGSAFDPTTSTVALRGRSHSLVRVDAQADDSLANTKAPPPLADRAALPAAALVNGANRARALPTLYRPYALPAREAQRRASSAQPRAPPHRAA